jgi:hypothetical protein
MRVLSGHTRIDGPRHAVAERVADAVAAIALGCGWRTTRRAKDLRTESVYLTFGRDDRAGELFMRVSGHAAERGTREDHSRAWWVDARFPPTQADVRAVFES